VTTGSPTTPDAATRLLRDAIAAAVAGGNLGEGTMRAVVEAIMDGAATPAQIGGLLTALRIKGETVDELVGTAQAMRARMLRVPADGLVVDTCGTGGDGADLFNVSTAVALVVAGAGVPVAKHGNRAQSGKVGGADVLETLGVRIDVRAGAGVAVPRARRRGLLLRAALHAAMRFAAARSRRDRSRTIFNFVGRSPIRRARPCSSSACPEPRGPSRWRRRSAASERARLVVHGAGTRRDQHRAHPRQRGRRDGVRTYDLRPRTSARRHAAPPQVADAAESAAVIRAVPRASRAGAATSCW
jgi:anthranilate phosphoribosyltransferase